jgi:plasmid stabilization system protein ParE
VNLTPSFRRQAFVEYVAARRWYEKQRPGLGSDFEAEIERALLRACASPQRCRELMPGVRRIRVHRFPFGIYFRVRRELLVVLAVFHARRNPDSLRARTRSTKARD